MQKQYHDKCKGFSSASTSDAEHVLALIKHEGKVYLIPEQNKANLLPSFMDELVLMTERLREQANLSPHVHIIELKMDILFHSMSGKNT